MSALCQKRTLHHQCDRLVGPRFTDGLTFRKVESSWACRVSVTIRDIASGRPSWGRGAMTTFDYIAIGVLIALGVFAIAAVSSGKFKL
jgi:hypothetical protein